MSDIVNSGNHYCISLKGNQPKLLRQAQQSATVQVSESVDYSLLDSSHGRRVERRVRVFKAARELSQIWTNLAAFVEVERFGLRDGHSFHHRSWYILSHCIPAQQAAQLIQNHRGKDRKSTALGQRCDSTGGYLRYSSCPACNCDGFATLGGYFNLSSGWL